MRTPLHLLILIVAIAGLQACRNSMEVVISKHVDPTTIKRVAIFKMDRLSYRENDKISDLLIHEFLRLGYDVVERTELERLVKEQKLGASGFVDPNKAVEIGKLAGADSIVIGSGALAEKEKDVLKYFVIKIVDLKSGSVVVTASLRNEESIKNAIGDLSAALKRSLEDHQKSR
ncbi:CsgG/HfaB family protein [Turneriella parva]|uniref:Curli production assembly/transport component CsgG n=1 Tax=Turneriella parva (strain ATCC BAA-1111 / DSM 21527 / NCTC 11395 / H) TaxID=869212 RepID=I4B2X8_TURPD|nr:CsgG/HfaB family protein [Turneriella parva]AFM11635.1 hypothetical protein Turpa_0986 [Turneriella parva DSM 21527]